MESPVYSEGAEALRQTSSDSSSRQSSGELSSALVSDARRHMKCGRPGTATPLCTVVELPIGPLLLQRLALPKAPPFPLVVCTTSATVSSSGVSIGYCLKQVAEY